LIEDIHFLEAVIGRTGDGCERPKITGISQLIDIEDLVTGTHQDSHRCGTDKAAAASDQNSH
jgi:hypothetical protein